MRLVTDPIVDFIAYVITRFLLPPWIQLLRKFANASTSFATTVTASIFGNSTADNISQFSNKLVRSHISFLLALTLISAAQYEHSLEIFENPLSHFAFWSTTRIAETAPAPEPEFLFPEYARFLEPYFALLGKEVRLSGSASLAAWTRMAVGNGPTNKVFAIILGYSVFGLMLAVYLNLLTVGNARTAGRAIRNAIRQQLLVVKVRAVYVLGSLYQL
jgi:E3 ubiquitin-protein ligase MARCH6